MERKRNYSEQISISSIPKVEHNQELLENSTQPCVSTVPICVRGSFVVVELM